jgi:hypothetical protein
MPSVPTLQLKGTCCQALPLKMTFTLGYRSVRVHLLGRTLGKSSSKNKAKHNQKYKTLLRVNLPKVASKLPLSYKNRSDLLPKIVYKKLANFFGSTGS